MFYMGGFLSTYSYWNLLSFQHLVLIFFHQIQEIFQSFSFFFFFHVCSRVSFFFHLGLYTYVILLDILSQHIRDNCSFFLQPFLFLCSDQIVSIALSFYILRSLICSLVMPYCTHHFSFKFLNLFIKTIQSSCQVAQTSLITGSISTDYFTTLNSLLLPPPLFMGHTILPFCMPGNFLLTVRQLDAILLRVWIEWYFFKQF